MIKIDVKKLYRWYRLWYYFSIVSMVVSILGFCVVGFVYFLGVTIPIKSTITLFMFDLPIFLIMWFVAGFFCYIVIKHFEALVLELPGDG